MASAESNKKIRKELKATNKEISALSSIYGQLLQFLSEEQKQEFFAEARKAIFERLDQKEALSFFERDSGKCHLHAMESDIQKLIDPNRPSGTV